MTLNVPPPREGLPPKIMFSVPPLSTKLQKASIDSGISKEDLERSLRDFNLEVEKMYKAPSLITMNGITFPKSRLEEVKEILAWK